MLRRNAFGPEPRGILLVDVLLEEIRAVDPVGIPFQRQGAVFEMRQQEIGDRVVIVE